jgi:hypothetical protein
MVSTQVKHAVKHIEEQLFGSLENVKGQQGSTFEYNNTTTATRKNGTKFHLAYAIIVTEKEEIKNDFFKNYNAWLKVKDL